VTVWTRANSLVLLLIWLAAAPWLFFPKIVPVLTAISLVLLLLLLFSANNRPLPTSPINGYLLVFLLLTGIAYLVSPLPGISLPKLTVVILGTITYFLILPRLSTVERVEQLMLVMVLIAGIVALGGFFTLEWPDRQIFDLRPITDRLPHVGGSFSINYNEMAGTLLVFFPFVLAAVRREDGRVQKGFASLVLLLMMALLFFTQSRGAFLGLLVLGLTLRFWGRVPLRKIAPVIIVLGLGLVLVGLVAGLSLADTFDWLSAIDASSKQGDAPATSWLARLEIWQVAGQMLADYPVMGSGLYTFDPVSRANYVYETILPSFNLTHAHNLFLQSGASLGIGGILSLAGIWVTVLFGLWQAGNAENERVRGLATVFAASIVGYLFFNLFDTITFGQKPGIFVWLILAGAIGLSQLAGEETAAARLFPGKWNHFRPARLYFFGPLLLLVLLLLLPALPKNLANLKLDKARFQSGSQITLSAADFAGDGRRAGLFYHLGGRDEQAMAEWRYDPKGGAFLESQGTIAFMSGELVEAISWYNLALELAPDSAEIYLWRGVANEERGMIDLAEADFWKAAGFTAGSEVSDSTKAYIYYRLGLVLAEKKDWQAAVIAFSQATKYEPDETWYFQELGDALAALGDQAGASDAYQKAGE
jgi:putative inorganic carbon (HCO3(-)) transporter